MEAASAYLASRMRTVAEVRQRLRDKEYDEGEIEDAVRELIELGYLDDYQYALRYYEYNREKKRGSLRAMRELSEKGVDEATIKNAREDFLYENKVDEYADALNVGMKIVEDSEDKTDPDKLQAKAARRLESAGYQKGDIIKVLEKIGSQSKYDGDGSYE